MGGGEGRSPFSAANRDAVQGWLSIPHAGASRHNMHVGVVLSLVGEGEHPLL